MSHQRLTAKEERDLESFKDCPAIFQLEINPVFSLIAISKIKYFQTPSFIKESKPRQTGKVNRFKVS